MILIMVFFNFITNNNEYLKYLYIIVVPLGGSTSEKRYLAFSLSFCLPDTLLLNGWYCEGVVVFSCRLAKYV